jgi:hypothetical protein
MTNQEKARARTLAGKCPCGAVHYAVADEFVYAANCHCSNCRRATGSAFKPFAGIERGKLDITKGEDNLMIYGDESGNDTRCKLCGSFLYSVVRDGAFVHVAMGGTLVDEPIIRPTKHNLRRLQGAVVHNYRRRAPIPRACGGRRICRRIDLWVGPGGATPEQNRHDGIDLLVMGALVIHHCARQLKRLMRACPS